MEEGSRVTWLTTVQITSEGREQSDLTYNLQTNCGLTVVGREQSDLTHNSENYQWRKGAKWQTDYGFTVGEREQSDLTYNSAYYQWRKRAKRPDVQFTNWLWPYCCRKGAEWPDLQQCKLWRKGAEWPDLQQCILPVKEGSRATWLIIVQITSKGREQSNLTYNLQTDCGLTVVGREQSDLTHNSENYQWRKGAKQ